MPHCENWALHICNQNVGSALAKPAAVRFLEGFLTHCLTVRKIFNTTIILILRMTKQKHREENLMTCPL